MINIIMQAVGISEAKAESTQALMEFYALVTHLNLGEEPPLDEKKARRLSRILVDQCGMKSDLAERPKNQQKLMNGIVCLDLGKGPGGPSTPEQEPAVRYLMVSCGATEAQAKQPDNQKVFMEACWQGALTRRPEDEVRIDGLRKCLKQLGFKDDKSTSPELQMKLSQGITMSGLGITDIADPNRLKLQKILLLLGFTREAANKKRNQDQCDKALRNFFADGAPNPYRKPT